eukprot:scaffold24080_cov142-Cylindrotheca_fusiformis.AAC.1
MQLLVPPVDDNHGEESVNGSTASRGGRESSVLSNDLREQFENMKTAWRRARRSTGDDGEELRRKEEERAALDTAVAVESEMERWRNGIAELEAMLAEEEEDDESSAEGEGNRPQELVVRFPYLPPVVPSDEEDDEDISPPTPEPG